MMYNSGESKNADGQILRVTDKNIAFDTCRRVAFPSPEEVPNWFLINLA